MDSLGHVAAKSMKNDGNSSKKVEATKDDSSNSYEKDRKRRIECLTPIQIENETTKSIIKKKKGEEEFIKCNPKQEKDISLEEGKDVFSLLVSNIPYHWSCEQITDYINENCVDVYALEQLEGGDVEAGQKIHLTFTQFEQCNKARKQLKLKAIDGRKLDVAFIIPGESESDGEMDKPLSHRRSMIQPSLSAPSWEPNVDVWATESSGTYGLKQSYLESLGIKPPIDKWVHVSNFRCDKSELKEALELAGQVVICRVVSSANKFATVMYSHPLEAVQAVAMLNGQTFYGQVLKISMYKCENNDFLLPKGLVKIGPGFGIDGKPLRDIVQHYERYLNGKTNCINETIFNVSSNDTDFIVTGNGLNTDESIDANVKEVVNNENNEINEQSRSNGNNPTPKMANISVTITQSHVQNNPNTTPTGPTSAPVHSNGTSNLIVTPFSNKPITSQSENKSFRPGINPVGYNIPVLNRHPAPVQVGHQDFMVSLRVQHQQNRPIGPRGQPFLPTVQFHNPRNQGLVTPVNTNVWGRPMSGNMQANVPLPQKTSSVVEISNLPLSTTFPILSEKMAQVGQVISLELTRVGCAVVRFATPAQAQMCYLHYNKLFVMGNTIEVKFL